MFAANPLPWLDELAASGEGARRLPSRQLCVADARTGRNILHNKDGCFAEHSDFFTTRRGVFEPRSAQQAMAREARSLLSEGLARADVEAAVAQFGRESDWPGSGCALLADLSLPLLAARERSERFRSLLAEIVRVRILERGIRRPGLVRSAVRKRQFLAGFARERSRADQPSDTLGLVFAHGGTASDAQLAEIFLGFVFSLASSVGLTLGWTLKLAVSHGRTGLPPDHLVSEALRLYPIAWWMARRPAEPMTLLGHRIDPSFEVIVSPYAIHRNPAYWTDSTRFAPERWAEPVDRSAWLPFGAGAHSCVAMGLTFGLLRRLLDAFLGRSWRIEGGTGAPLIGVALAPPLFRLVHVPR
jgi:cytochrome P450